MDLSNKFMNKPMEIVVKGEHKSHDNIANRLHSPVFLKSTVFSCTSLIKNRPTPREFGFGFGAASRLLTGRLWAEPGPTTALIQLLYVRIFIFENSKTLHGS